VVTFLDALWLEKKRVKYRELKELFFDTLPSTLLCIFF
jgi:hypothetical protein